MDGLFVSNFPGKTSFAAISLILPFVFAMGSLGFMIGKGGAAIIALPLFIDLDGIWLAVVAAETMALVLAIFFFVRKKNQYHYA